MDPSMRLALGVFWAVSGALWLRKAMQDDARPSEPVSTFTEPELKTAKDRSWQIHIGVLNLLIAAVYLAATLFTWK